MLAADRLLCQSKGNFWQGVRTNRGVVQDASRRNRFYFEAHFTETGLARIGWSLGHASHDLGTCKAGWGYGGTAKKSNCKNFSDYGQTFGEKGDIIGNLIDLDTGEISWFKNGVSLGVGFKIPDIREAIFPAICTKNAPLLLKLDSDTKAPASSVWVGQTSESQWQTNPLDGDNQSKGEPVKKAPKAVIIEPSRELAEQTFNCLLAFKKYLADDIKVLLVIGGSNAKDQMSALNAGVDIVVATPGRLNDLVTSGSLRLQVF